MSMARRLFIFCFLFAGASVLSPAPAQTPPAPQPAHGRQVSAPNAIPSDRATADLIEFLSRKAVLKDADIEPRLALARWARDRQLWAQAQEMARETLDRDPDNRPAWAIMQQADQAIALPEEPDVEAALIGEFDRRFHRTDDTPAHAAEQFKSRNSRHFLICYDTTDAFAASRGIALEKAYDAFMFFFNMDTLRPTFLEKRLVVILFQNRDDYLHYAKATEGADLSWAAGYYSQRTNRTVFYDDSTSPAAESVDKQIAKLKDQLNELNAQIEQAKDRHQNGLAGSLTAERNRIGNAIYEINARVDNALGLMNTVKTTHEAAHQLAFNTGIQKRLVDYPLWLSEGLACSFEIEDGKGRRGPNVLNPGRIAVLKDAIKRNRLIPLEEFITDPQPAIMDEHSMSIFYAQGWALFHYLYTTDRPGLEKYLLAYKALPPIRQVMPEQRRKLFTDAFGDDFDALQKKFTAYLKDLPPKAP